MSSLSMAQSISAGNLCAASKQKFFRSMAKTTVLSPDENNYDVKYVKLDLNLTNQSTAINGNVTTKAIVIAASMPQYVFELNSLLTIDSAKINGQILPVTNAVDTHTVVLPTALALNTPFTAQVFYHGTPTSGTLSATTGINNLTSPSWGAQATFTLSEPYEAKDWWPCKQSLMDRIDSADIWITVPASIPGLKAGSNGILQRVTTLGTGDFRYEWKEKNQIDYYLISAAVAPYVDYSFYVHFPGNPDSLLVQNYVYNNPATLPNFKSVIDSTALMLQYLSTVYGTYPFMNEKYGHCMGPLSGGMEHQTMTTLGFFEGTLVVHELGHQWFGDHVTCGTWKDIWLNEGFASYTEYLYVDTFWGPTSGYNYMKNFHTQNLPPNPATGSVYVDDTTSESRIFDSRLSYAKGASTVHTLRFVINNDSAFFPLLQAYQQNFAATGFATTDDFKVFSEAYLGASLDTFFNQWVYGQGYPIYTASWNQTGTSVMVKLNQTSAVPTSVPLFITPIEIKLRSTTGDTVVRVVNDQTSQIYSFNWDRSMTTMVIDPNDWILDLEGTITHDPSLVSVGQISKPNITVQPNPATHTWSLQHVPYGTSLQLTDISGRVLWEMENVEQSTVNIPAAQLSAGLYLLQTISGMQKYTMKLVKQ
ncbi:MAG: M1 family aminopeptidase [Bacteroidota bacterium]